MEVKEKVLYEKSSQDVERIREWKQNPKENDVSLLKSKTAREVSYSLKNARPGIEQMSCQEEKRKSTYRKHRVLRDMEK